MMLSWKKIAFYAALVWFSGLLVILGLLALVARDLPSLEQLERYEPQLATRLISADGVTIKEFYTQRRVYMPLERIPANLVNAAIATEDRRFYSHWGVDLIRLTKALMIDIVTLSKKQGASTITQQLARNLYFSHRQTVSRKLKELITAIQIEQRYSKREILEMYFTQTYFGSGAWGVQAGAQRYFGKNVEDLNLQECALLIAILKAPAHYSPLLKPEAALKRRNLVLYNLYRWGYISRDAYLTAIKEPSGVRPTEEEQFLGIGPYFTEYIRQRLEVKAKKENFDYYHDGLTVYTTLDSRLQYVAEQAVKLHLAELDSRFRSRFGEEQLRPFLAAQYPGLRPRDLEAIARDSAKVNALLRDKMAVQVALVALEPGSGKILAMIGGRDFKAYKFNRALQAVRQPGSAFKPFIYLAAIDNGTPPTYRLLNQDVVIEDGSGERWTPQNYDGSRGGLTTLRDGLKQSLNLVTVRLVQEVVFPQTVVDYAQRLGITTKIEAVDAIALGASGVIPIEIVSAFSVFPSGGVLAKPYGIERIVDKFGTVIAENSPRRQVVLSEQTAYIMTSLLQSVIDYGTGGSARWHYGFHNCAGGKTGTTNEFTDAWFIGFTPDLCAGVWAGLDDPFISLGEGQSGAEAALPIWADFMKGACDTLKLPDRQFKRPPGIVNLDVCTETYQIATRYCPKTIKEVFIEKYAPADSCTVHQGKRKYVHK